MKDWKKADEQGTKDYKHSIQRHYNVSVRTVTRVMSRERRRKTRRRRSWRIMPRRTTNIAPSILWTRTGCVRGRGADRVPPGGSIASDGRVLDASGQPVIDPTTGKPMIVDQNPKPEPRRNSIWKSIVAGANGLTLSRAPTSELPQTGQGNAQTPGSRFEAMEKKIKELEIDLKDDKGKKLVKLPEFRELLRWNKLIP